LRGCLTFGRPMRGRVPRLQLANRSARALAAAFFPFLIVAACSPNQASLAPFDVAQTIQATQAAGTARFSTTLTLEIADSGPRKTNEAEGIVDLVAVTGRLEGTLIPNPFPPPGEAVVPVEIEARTVAGHGFWRPASGGEWRAVEGSLGSFLQVGNHEVSFVEAMNEVLEPVDSWRPAGTDEVRGERTRHYSGVARGESRGPVEVWIDENGRLWRLLLTRHGVAPTNAVGVIVLEFWDFGVAVDVEQPT
jgi:hypothetical protein